VPVRILTTTTAHRSRTRCSAVITFGLVLGGVLTGCQSDGSSDPGTTGPGSSGAASSPTSRTSGATAGTAADCDDFGRSDQEKAGGPLQRQSNAMTYTMNYIRPGTLQDATVIPLINQTTSSVVIDSVDLVPDKDASPVTLDQAFVAPSNVVQTIGRVRDDDQYEPVAGHCLAPLGAADAPILGLRIGPSPPGDTGQWPVSRNNSVNIHYRTDDGQRYVAVIPFRFEYPNHRD
jgi:hypothetical protein